MPTSPYVSCSGAVDPRPSSCTRTTTDVAAASPSRSTVASTTVTSRAWRRTFVSDSARMRWTEAVSSTGTLRTDGSMVRRSGTPSATAAAPRASTSSQPTPGVVAASSRNPPIMRRIAVIASPPAVSMRCNASVAAAGLVAATCRAAWACTTMPVT